jgi:hypothetical protein
MKLARFVMVLSMLFLTSLLLAQKVDPTSLTLVAVPGYSSSPQGVAFTNTGDSEITLTISITGPFSIPTNKCGRGVKPGTHCNLDVVYTPQGIGTDTGTLGFTFNGQTVSVALTGNGVSIIPTSFSHVSHSSDSVKVTLYAEGDIIPDGEQVEVQCIDYIGVNEVTDFGTLKNNKATIGFTGDKGDDWECLAGYNGDPEFAESATGYFSINLCHNSCECHDTCGGGVTKHWWRDIR